MTTNNELAALFEEMADLLELSGENLFRIRAYRTGAKSIREMPESASAWVQAGKDLTDLDGIGSTLAEKANVYLSTGTLPQLEKLREEVPGSLRSIMAVPGVGAKKAMGLFKELQISDLPALRTACENNLVAQLKGFGEKSQKSILANMEITEQAAARLLLDQAESLSNDLRDYMSQCPEIKRLEFAGSYRRGKETVGDLDMLVTSDRPEVVMDHFSGFSLIQEIIQRGDTKMSVRVRDAFQIDLRVVEDHSWGAALQYFTGSKEHNVRIRGLAKAKGLKINEYGVFRVNSSGVVADDGKKAEEQPVAGESEEEIYELLGLTWIPPELREDRIEFASDAAKRIDKLITIDDLQGDLHMHTHATDGENSIEEMVQAAQARGLSYIAITDHSKRVSMARGLDEVRIRSQWEEIDRLNEKLGGTFWILKGVECDILENGEMDLSDDCLSEADWVIASIHYGQRQPIDQITRRILNALENPYVHAIGHPTGRLLGRREAYQVDLGQVMESALANRKVLELNANPQRLDLNDLNVQLAVEMGIMIAINTDAHSIPNLDLMSYGVKQARRAGVSADQVLNCLSIEKLRQRIQK